MPTRLSFEEVRESIENLGYRLINDNESDLIYRKGRLFVNIIDNIGYKYFTIYQSMKKCSPNIVHKSNSYSLENIELWLKINNKSFELCENNVYIDKEEKLKCCCFKYNDVFYVSWNNIRNNRCCSICFGKQTGERTSLSYLRPDLVEEFLYSENNKSSEEITLGSQEYVYWKCSDCGWKWWATLVDRTHNESGCPACAGNVVTDLNRLSIRFPKLVKEWDKNKNNNLTPYDVSFGMSKKVWWICSNCGNSWKTEICNRTSGKGCPECADEQKESKIATELKEYILENYYSEKEYKIFKNPKTNHFLPFDIYIYNNIFIEVHGPQHYKFSTLFYKTQEEFEYRQYLDKIKKEYAQQNGIYIEVDLRKIKTTEDAIEYVEQILYNN